LAPHPNYDAWQASHLDVNALLVDWLKRGSGCGWEPFVAFMETSLVGGFRRDEVR